MDILIYRVMIGSMQILIGIFLLLLPVMYREAQTLWWGGGMLLNGFGRILGIIFSYLVDDYPWTALFSLISYVAVVLGYRFFFWGTYFFFGETRRYLNHLSLAFVGLFFAGVALFLSTQRVIALAAHLLLMTAAQTLLTAVVGYGAMNRELPRAHKRRDGIWYSTRFITFSMMILTVFYTFRAAIVHDTFGDLSTTRWITAAPPMYLLTFLAAQIMAVVGFVVAHFTRSAERLTEDGAQSESEIARGTAVAGIVHEINNPAHWIGLSLGNIRNTLRPYAASLHNPYHQLEIVSGRVQEAVGEVTELVSHLRTWSVGGITGGGLANVSTAVEHVLSTIRTSWQQRPVDIRWDELRYAILVPISPARLEQAIIHGLHLVTAKRDCTRPEARISIESIKSIAGEQRVVIYISGNAGFTPPEEGEQESAYLSMRTTVIQRIIRENNGLFSYKLSAGHDAAVTVELPVASVANHAI